MANEMNRLEDLLVALFNEFELRRLLERMELGQGLPGAGVPRAQLAWEAVLLLERRGRINRDLFEFLLEHAGTREVEVRALAADLSIAEFQDSCRLAIQACFALDFEDALSYSGLRQTTRMGSQLRVFPDQRSGWRRRAAS